MSIRDNILFGKPFNLQKYELICEACALLQDFDELMYYDLTLIGEKGLNLSGGQKARIALARAFYIDADIIVLDDVFAALDSIVAKNIFEKGILQLMKHKTRIIVTHNIDIIRHDSVDAHIDMVDGDGVNGRLTFTRKSDRIYDSSQILPKSCIYSGFESNGIYRKKHAEISNLYAYSDKSFETSTNINNSNSNSSVESVGQSKIIIASVDEEKAEGEITSKVR